MENKFISTQDFRERATEEDYKALQNYINSLAKKTEGFPTEYYAFSYTSASNLIKEKNGNTSAETKKEFLITKDSLPNGEYKQRTFTVKEDTLKKLDDFCEKYSFYAKQSVITLLLEEALKIYE